jgi:serine/threonine protein kinase
LQESDPSRIGRYRLTARLGAGGMGVVYLAEPEGPQEPQITQEPQTTQELQTTQENQTTQKPQTTQKNPENQPLQVAVKLLRPELTDDLELRKRFAREVTSLLRVRGVCTVRVIEADTQARQPFLVTEYADGPSLAEYVDASGPLGAEMLYGLATGLAEALTAIHATGVVHRDLKPSNVLLTPSGPKVIDFGIAHVLDETAVTKTGMTVGSAGFMAPEQITGRAGTPADIFAWAVTIGYAASGKSPFGTGTSHATIYQILHAEPDIDAVPPVLRPLVAAALAKEPRDRPAAADLLAHLTGTPGRPGQAGGDSPTETVLLRTWRPAKATFDGPASEHPQKAKHGRPRPPGRQQRRRQPRRQPSRKVALPLTAVIAATATALGFTLASRPASSPAAARPATTVLTSEPSVPRPPSPGPATSPATTPSRQVATQQAAIRQVAAHKATPSQAAAGKAGKAGKAKAAAPALPVITIGDYTGTKPSEIAFSADSGNTVTGIDWTTWTAVGATGYGQSDLDLCIPTCVQAPASVVQTTIVLSDPVHGRFTRLAETRSGSTTTIYSYPADWPVSAS